MIRRKVFLGVIILVLLVMLPLGCGSPATPESPEDARDAMLSYLRENVMQDVPTSSTAWDRRDISSQGQLRKTTWFGLLGSHRFLPKQIYGILCIRCFHY